MNLLVVHNCDHRSEGHHGEGVKDDVLATLLFPRLNDDYLEILGDGNLQFNHVSTQHIEPFLPF